MIKINNVEIKNSQNFLYDKKTISNLIDISNLDKSDCILEIGAGKGIITELLYKNVKNVIAIEKDTNLFNILITKFKDYKNVKLLNEDILNYNFYQLNYFKIFSNIPFNITTNILNKIISIDNKPSDMYLVMQEEAAKRYIGNPFCGETLKSIILKVYYNIKIIYKFKNTDFKPVPKVNIVFVHFKKSNMLNIEESKEFIDFVTYIFENKGFTLKDRIKKIFSYEQLKKISKNININVSIKDILFNDWLYIFEIYKTKVSLSKKVIIKRFL